VTQLSPITTTAFSLAYTKKEFDRLSKTLEQTVLTPGPQGEQGLRGYKGDKGVKGDRGQTGSTGIQGEKGDAGTDGNDGEQGVAGEVGAQGESGQQGPQGESGPQGKKGEAGEQGTVGPEGTIGARGARGEKGDEGVPGVAGAVGAIGPYGDKGDQGIPGPAGSRGTKGTSGTKGDKGDKGDVGEKGDRGDTGSPGEKGDIGDQGTPAPDYRKEFEQLVKDFNVRVGENQELINKNVDQQIRRLSSFAGGGGSYKILDNADVEKTNLLSVTGDSILIYDPIKKLFVVESFADIVDRIRTDVETQYNRLIDVVSNITYIGEALPGTATSGSTWRIKRVEEVVNDINILWADGTADFTKVWDNRLSLSYS
jgi:hypothetical protein